MTSESEKETAPADKPTVQHVHARFCEIFGPPHQTLGKDFHWALRDSESALPVNVLMNGTLETAALWVFDPTEDPGQAVYKTFITHDSHIDESITEIHRRLKRAGEKSK